MKKIIFSHFYNEEFLLPFWLEHHKKIFDHGVLFDYDSTDSSCEIIKKICPTWEIIRSRNKQFSAQHIEEEILEKEATYEPGDYRIILNTTEFLFYKDNAFHETREKRQFLIPSLCMVDNNPDKIINYNKSLISQKYFGYPDNNKSRRSRSMHNFYIEKYPLGRHFSHSNTSDFIICWFGFSPYEERLLERKTQIKNKIPNSDFQRGWGFQHQFSKDRIFLEYQKFKKQSYDLREILKEYKNYGE